MIKGYKGFDTGLKCQGFQYKIGESYEHPGPVKCCPGSDDLKKGRGGFHFCENPLDVFGYYPPGESRFAEVDGDGEQKANDGDSKVACKKIHIAAELNVFSLVQAGVKFIFDHVDWKNKKETNTGYRSAATNTGHRSAATNTGYRSAATNTGYRSAATNTGDSSAATNTGYRSAASVEGKESIACGLGYGCKAKGALGCWIVLAERGDDYKILTVKTAKVDGKKIKADTWYFLEGGKLKEVKP